MVGLPLSGFDHRGSLSSFCIRGVFDCWRRSQNLEGLTAFVHSQQIGNQLSRHLQGSPSNPKTGPDFCAQRPANSSGWFVSNPKAVTSIRRAASPTKRLQNGNFGNSPTRSLGGPETHQHLLSAEFPTPAYTGSHAKQAGIHGTPGQVAQASREFHRDDGLSSRVQTARWS